MFRRPLLLACVGLVAACFDPQQQTSPPVPRELPDYPRTNLALGAPYHVMTSWHGYCVDEIDPDGADIPCDEQDYAVTVDCGGSDCELSHLESGTWKTVGPRDMFHGKAYVAVRLLSEGEIDLRVRLTSGAEQKDFFHHIGARTATALRMVCFASYKHGYPLCDHLPASYSGPLILQWASYAADNALLFGADPEVLVGGAAGTTTGCSYRASTKLTPDMGALTTVYECDTVEVSLPVHVEATFRDLHAAALYSGT